MRMSAPAWMRWVAKEWRRVWQVTRLSIPARRAVPPTALCTADSWRWCLTVRPVLGKPKTEGQEPVGPVGVGFGRSWGVGPSGDGPPQGREGRGAVGIGRPHLSFLPVTAVRGRASQGGKRQASGPLFPENAVI